MVDDRRLEEQALSKVAETQLSAQMSAAKEIDVDIRTDLIEMVQGQVSSVSVVAKELVTQQNLRVQEVQLQTDRVAIDLLSALCGKIELKQPIDSTGRIVVTEADINQSLNSDYICNKLIPLQLKVDDQIVLLKLQPPMELRLPGNGKLVFSSNIEVPEGNQPVRFTGVMYPRTHEHSVLMERFSFGAGEAIPLEVMVAFMEKLKELVNLPYLEFGGTAFRIQEMQVHKGSITLHIEAHINQLPSL